MQDANETLCDRDETPCNGDEETRAIEARLDRIEAMRHDMHMRLDRIRRWILFNVVYTAVLMAILVYVGTTYR